MQLTQIRLKQKFIPEFLCLLLRKSCHQLTLRTNLEVGNYSLALRNCR